MLGRPSYASPPRSPKCRRNLLDIVIAPILASPTCPTTRKSEFCDRILLSAASLLAVSTATADQNALSVSVTTTTSITGTYTSGGVLSAGSSSAANRYAFVLPGIAEHSLSTSHNVDLARLFRDQGLFQQRDWKYVSSTGRMDGCHADGRPTLPRASYGALAVTRRV